MRASGMSYSTSTPCMPGVRRSCSITAPDDWIIEHIAEDCRPAQRYSLRGGGSANWRRVMSYSDCSAGGGGADGREAKDGGGSAVGGGGAARKREDEAVDKTKVEDELDCLFAPDRFYAVSTADDLFGDDDECDGRAGARWLSRDGKAGGFRGDMASWDGVARDDSL